MKHVIFFALFLLPNLVSAQDLYLKMDGTLPRHNVGEWVIPDDEPNSIIYSKVYGYKSYILYNELWFVCKERSTFSTTLPLSALSNYPNLKTIDQLEVTVAGLSYNQVWGWFKGFQNIYIVEILPNGTQIEVSKVILATVVK